MTTTKQRANPGHATQTPPITRAPWRDGLSAEAMALLTLPTATETLTDASQREVDVVVIGAGVTGLSAAQATAAAGLRTLLLEAAPTLGAGASGRNAGILSAGANAPLSDLAPDSPIAALWPATTRLLLDLVAEAGKPGSVLSARQTGALNIATSQTAARRVASEARTRQAAGLRADVWSPQQVADITGGRLNTRDITAALWLPDEGRINPLTLLAHLGQRARAAGATLVGLARAKPPTVATTKSAKAAKPQWRVTFAEAGAAGKAQLTIHARGLIDAVGPTTRPTARLYALAFLADLPDDFPLFWDAAPYVYYDYRGGDGRLVVSGGRYGQVGATERDAAYHARMAVAARRWLPELAAHAPHYAWAVDLDTAADRLPTVISLDERDGRPSDAPGLAIVGLGAQGVLPGITLGQQAGEQLARLLA